MKEYIEKQKAEKILYDGCHTTDGREILDDVVELWHEIQSIPAADVREVKRGKWIKRMEVSETPAYKAFTPVWKCSECGLDYDPGVCRQIKYCYNCGAEMRGEEDHV